MYSNLYFLCKCYEMRANRIERASRLAQRPEMGGVNEKGYLVLHKMPGTKFNLAPRPPQSPYLRRSIVAPRRLSSFNPLGLTQVWPPDCLICKPVGLRTLSVVTHKLNSTLIRPSIYELRQKIMSRSPESPPPTNTDGRTHNSIGFPTYRIIAKGNQNTIYLFILD